MSADKEEQSKLPIATMVGLCMALVAWWFIQEPLKSTRPEGGRLGSKEGAIQARLWQDPVETVQNHEGLDTVIGFNEVTTDNHIGILIVITEGGPYVENREKRLRDRYAVVSALGEACFFPKDAEHIGAYKSLALQALIPFEWYQSQLLRHCHDDEKFEQHYDRVLVLWTTDSMLGKEPLRNLQQFSAELANQYRSVGCVGLHTWDCISKYDMKIIGPPDSGSLRVMLKELENEKATWLWPNFKDPEWRIELYSPWATADPDLLIQGVNKRKDGDGCHESSHGLKAYLCRGHVRLEYAVISDRELSTALVEELIRRQVDLRTDAIALVSEWDTFYGRALPAAFQVAACVVLRQIPWSSPLWARDECISDQTILNKVGKIRRYTYLQGLDGLTPNGAKQKEVNHEAQEHRNSNVRDAVTQAEQLRALETPDGQSQLDYVRRLVAKIKKDADENANHSGRALKAIGVLGSDVHDTLLILQALRQEFPNVLFFTTNLDARLLKEENYKWVRNVVVSSPFGLQLHDAIQRETPPFRDSYQTSAFFATLRAVAHIRHTQTSSNDTFGCKESQSAVNIHENYYQIDLVVDEIAKHLCPRLFEVGRSGLVDLSADRETLALRDTDITIQPIRELKPRGMRVWWKGVSETKTLGFTATLGWLVFAFLLILIFFSRFIGHAKNLIVYLAEQFNIGEKWLTLLSGGSLLLIGWSLLAMLETIKQQGLKDGWEGEPFSVSDGVSTWPAIAIRLALFLWCVISICGGWLYLKWNHLTLDRQYKWQVKREDVSPPVKLLNTLRKTLSYVIWVMTVPLKNERPVSVEGVYAEYAQAGHMWYRIVRACLLTAMSVLFMFIVLAALDQPGMPVNPSRGTFNSKLVDYSVRLVVPIMMFLNMFVFDAVMLCQGFVSRLRAGGSVQWPDHVLDEYVSKRWCDRDFLPDLLTVKIVANRTQAVHKLVFAPFIALFLIVVSRNRYFDNWDFPSGLLLIWTIYAVVALWSMARLRSVAKDVRATALRNLRELLSTEIGMGKSREQKAEQIGLIIEEVNNTKQGAYVPVFQHPVVGTSLLILLSLLQYWLLGS